MLVAHAQAYCSVISIGIGCYGFWRDCYVFKNSASGKLLERNKVDVADPILINKMSKESAYHLFLLVSKFSLYQTTCYGHIQHQFNTLLSVYKTIGYQEHEGW
jgi:hypothetical protein